MTEIGSVPHAYYAREAPLTGVVLLPRQERHDPGEHPENVRRFPGVVEHLRAAPEWDLPLPPGSGDREHLEALNRVALPVIEAFAPQLLIVSAGQDGHAADPLSSQLVSAAGFRALAERAAALAKRLGIGLVLVHEGGYNVSTLPALDRAILAGLGGFDVDCEDVFVPADAHVPDGWEERMRAILDVQRRHWPELR